MGFSLRWFAVCSKKPQEIISDVGLRASGRRECVPEAKISSVMLSNGWFVVLFNDFDHPLVSPQTFATVSEGAELVACDIEEHCMYSRASAWQNGQWLWSIEHDSQRGLTHLDANGKLPEAYTKISTELLAKQAAEETQRRKFPVDHVFDVPIQVAKLLTGFVHDRMLDGLGPVPFEVLEPKPMSPFLA